jgi:hypothetical protein
MVMLAPTQQSLPILRLLWFQHDLNVCSFALGCRFDSFVVLSGAGTLSYYRGNGNTVDYPQVAIKHSSGKKITAGMITLPTHQRWHVM